MLYLSWDMNLESEYNKGITLPSNPVCSVDTSRQKDKAVEHEISRESK